MTDFRCWDCDSILEKDEGYETIRRCKNESCDKFNMPMSCEDF